MPASRHVPNSSEYQIHKISPHFQSQVVTLPTSTSGYPRRHHDPPVFCESDEPTLSLHNTPAYPCTPASPFHSKVLLLSHHLTDWVLSINDPASDLCFAYQKVSHLLGVAFKNSISVTEVQLTKPFGRVVFSCPARQIFRIDRQHYRFEHLNPPF